MSRLARHLRTGGRTKADLTRRLESQRYGTGWPIGCPERGRLEFRQGLVSGVPPELIIFRKSTVKVVRFRPRLSDLGSGFREASRPFTRFDSHKRNLKDARPL